MKKLHTIAAGLFALSTLFSVSGCESLDTVPSDYFTNNSYWKDAAQVSGYAVGLHTFLRNSYASNFLMGELRGGLLGDGDDGSGVSIEGASMYNQQIIKQDVRQNQALFSNWNGIYSYIVRCNLLLEQIDGCGFLSDTQKAYYKAQAYGMRAYYYFLLYRTWGGVPYVTDVAIDDGEVSAERLYRKRATAEEIMTLLKADVTASEENFDAAGTAFVDVYTWNKYATLMLKANIYTWSARVTTGNHTATGTTDLEVAKTALQSIISSGKFSLETNYTDVFSPDNKANEEIIMAIAYNSTDKVYTPTISYGIPQSNLITTLYDSTGTLIVLDNSKYGFRAMSGGLLRYQYKESFWRTFESGDTRREGTFYNLFKTANGTKTGTDFGIIMRKFIGHYDASETTHYFDSDGILFRYAETLLLMAEVENALGNDPTSYINLVRQRALGSGYTAVSNGTTAENELAILKERDKEFIFEGKRWFDVIRMQDANGDPLVFSDDANYPYIPGASEGSILDKTTESYKLLWPIDTSTLTNDPLLEQNPGYEM